MAQARLQPMVLNRSGYSSVQPGQFHDFIVSKTGSLSYQLPV